MAKENSKDYRDEDVGMKSDETTDSEGGEDTPNEDGIFEVERIMDMDCRRRGKCPVKFLVRWKGYSEEDDTWLPVSDLNCEDLVKEFLEASGRSSEYAAAMTPRKRVADGGETSLRTRKVVCSSCGEFGQDKDEIMPGETRARIGKVKGKPGAGTPPPKKKYTVLEKHEATALLDCKGKKLIPTPSASHPKSHTAPTKYEVEAVLDHKGKAKLTPTAFTPHSQNHSAPKEYKVKAVSDRNGNDELIPRPSTSHPKKHTAPEEYEVEAVLDRKGKNKLNPTPSAHPSAEHEVEAVLDCRVRRRLTEYKVRWKDRGPQHDSWVPLAKLRCDDLLNKYVQMDEGNVEEFFEVQEIMDRREVEGRIEYKVRCKGWGTKYDSWLPEEELNCPDLLTQFNANRIKNLEEETYEDNKKESRKQGRVKRAPLNCPGPLKQVNAKRIKNLEKETFEDIKKEAGKQDKVKRAALNKIYKLKN